MRQRPLCCACLIFLALTALLDAAGLTLIRGNPLSKELQIFLEDHPEVLAAGTVESTKETESGGSLILKQAVLLREDRDTKEKLGNVKVYTSQFYDIKPGTQVLMAGTLERVPGPSNPGEFDSQNYYASDHIYYFLKKASLLKQSQSYSIFHQRLLDLKTTFSLILTRCAGEQAPVFSAILLGDKSSLDEETRLRYQMAGIIHILAISGLHISILGTGLFRLLCKTGLGLSLSCLFSLVVMLCYGIMTGGSLSTMRAVVMFLIYAGAKILGRIYDLPTALAISAVLLVVESPAVLGSASFLFSFGAVLGVTLVGGTAIEDVECRMKLYRLLRGMPEKRLASAWEKTILALLASACVQAATLPVSLCFYGEVSCTGILLNLLVLPTAGLVLASALAAVCGGGAGLWLCGSAVPGRILALPGRFLLMLYEKMAGLMGKLPFAVWVGGKPAAWRIFVYYGFLLTAIWLWKREKECCEDRIRRIQERKLTGAGKKTEFRFGIPGARTTELSSGNSESAYKTSLWEEKAPGRKYALAAALLLAVGVFLLGDHHSSCLRITCVDVGQGDGILIQTPEGRNYMIDGGSSSKKKVGRYQLLPVIKSLGIHRLDGIWISHTDLDHISGAKELMELKAQNLSSVSIGALYLPDWGASPPEEWLSLQGLARQCGAEVHSVARSDVFTSGDLTLKVLAPLPGCTGEDVNEEGMVLLAEYKDFKALFTGDMGEETERKILDDCPDIDFLKVGHHGSRYSSGSLFLEKIKPEIGVISCSARNRYGHPSREAVDRLTQAGCRLEYTMKSGAVTILADGENIWVKRFIR